MASNAVAQNRISAVVGYNIGTANFNPTSPNLPQRIAVLAEANTANQSGLSTLPVEITSAKQAGDLYGYGSPIYLIARILKPQSGGGTSVPVVIYPQAAAVGATARTQTITVTGTATANATHFVKVAGRNLLDGQAYAVNVITGDTATVVAGKVRDAINAVLGAPVSATNSAGVVTATAKWAGLTSQGILISIDQNGAGAGLTYVVAETVAGSGTPDIGAALTSFGAEWNTITINSYGTDSTTMAALEAWNGIPLNSNPTGRYAGIIMKPTVAITGTVADNPTSAVSSRQNEVTIALAPAPKSPGLQFEAAANMAVLFAQVAQDTPHLDVAGMSYPDMPMPDSGTVIAMGSYDTRDQYVKLGSSTVDIVAGRYQVKDFVTSYHPAGEIPAQFRYPRNLMVDFNIRFGFYDLEQAYVVGKAIASDGAAVIVSDVVKPKTWKSVLVDYADQLESRGLIARASFMKDSLNVTIGNSNSDRIDTTFRYERTGLARISATTATAGFYFGQS